MCIFFQILCVVVKFDSYCSLASLYLLLIELSPYSAVHPAVALPTMLSLHHASLLLCSRFAVPPAVLSPYSCRAFCRGSFYRALASLCISPTVLSLRRPSCCQFQAALPTSTVAVMHVWNAGQPLTTQLLCEQRQLLLCIFRAEPRLSQWD